MQLIQIVFDQTTLFAPIVVVVTCMIVGDDSCCVNVLSDVLRDIGHNALKENLISVDLVFGTLFLYVDKKWMVEGIDEDDVTASNTDDDMICLKKTLIIDAI